jgi:hypothetical protein
MEAVRTSETAIDNYFTRQHILEDNSELQSSSSSAIFVHKRGSETHRVTKNLVGESVSYTDAKEKDSGRPFRFALF